MVYTHMAGGERGQGVYHDTHAHPVGEGPLKLLERVVAKAGPLPVLLERDRDFGDRLELEAELDAIQRIVRPRAEVNRVG